MKRTPSNELPSTSSSNSSFKHRSTRACSLRKAESALPSSPGKRKEIITNLASRYSIRVVLHDAKKPGPKALSLTKAEEEWLVSSDIFFDSNCEQ